MRTNLHICRQLVENDGSSQEILLQPLKYLSIFLHTDDRPQEATDLLEEAISISGSSLIAPISLIPFFEITLPARLGDTSTGSNSTSRKCAMSRIVWSVSIINLRNSTIFTFVESADNWCNRSLLPTARLMNLSCMNITCRNSFSSYPLDN